MMIRALPKIRSAIPTVMYSVVGDGPDLKFLKQLAEELDVTRSVQFLGETTDDELAMAYQQCDLFALPNREIDGDIEGFGMVLLEAQASGRPVIAGDSGGTRETMSPGVTGKILDCTTPDALGNGVIAMLKQPQLLDSMGKTARTWVVDRFDWNALSNEARQLFESD